MSQLEYRMVNVCQDRLTAIHEAGHAVAAYYLGVSFPRVTIEPDARSRGRVMMGSFQLRKDGEFNLTPARVRTAENRAIVAYAGCLSCRRLDKRSRWRATGAADFEVADELLDALAELDDTCGPDAKARRAYKALLRRRAEVLVEMRWRQIVSVGAALTSARTLSWDNVRAAIRRSIGAKLAIGED